MLDKSTMSFIMWLEKLKIKDKNQDWLKMLLNSIFYRIFQIVVILCSSLEVLTATFEQSFGKFLQYKSFSFFTKKIVWSDFVKLPNLIDLRANVCTDTYWW